MEQLSAVLPYLAVVLQELCLYVDVREELNNSNRKRADRFEVTPKS